MHYELYLDLFFMENFMIDSLLLAAENRILKCGSSWIRLLAGGAVGSLLTCVTLAVPVPGVIRLFLYYVLDSGIMLCVGFGIGKGIKSREMFLKLFLVLYVLSVVTGGFMYLFRPVIRNLSVFYFVAVLSYGGLIGIWKGIARVFRRQAVAAEVTLYTKRGTFTVKGLWDTGNELHDYVTGDPVSILSPKLADQLSENVEDEKGFHFLPYRCVAGEKMMKAFRIEKMCVHMEQDCWIREPLLGISEESLSDREKYEIILNPGVLTK